MENQYFAKEKVNAGRQSELDLLKALCVVGMIFTHVFLDLGNNAMPSAVDDYLTEFFGAATFMISMGIGMCYTRRQSPAVYLARGFALLTIGQFLNILRNALPNLIAWWITGKQFFIANALLILQSDILTFAGLAFLLMALFKMCRLKPGVILGISVLMNVAALVMWHTVPSPENYLVSQMAAFFVITDAEAYFPLLCYFIFVAFGYFVGGYYPRIRDKKALANRVMLVCFPLAAVYYVVRFTQDLSWLPKLGTDLQYNMKPTPDAIATCLFTLGFLALLARIMLAAGGRLPRVIAHFAENINSYYCIHYMFVLPVQTILIATTGHLLPGSVIPFLYALFVTGACYAIITLNDRYWHIHFVTLKGPGLIAFTACVWILTVVITAYAYPRIEVYANIWNEYLLP